MHRPTPCLPLGLVLSHQLWGLLFVSVPQVGLYSLPTLFAGLEFTLQLKLASNLGQSPTSSS